jgi:hypothetical protein
MIWLRYHNFPHFIKAYSGCQVQAFIEACFLYLMKTLLKTGAFYAEGKEKPGIIQNLPFLLDRPKPQLIVLPIS